MANDIEFVERPSYVATTPQLLSLMDDARRRDFNRQLDAETSAQLDPGGRHLITPKLIHHHAQFEEVEPHYRCMTIMKLTGVEQGYDELLDFSIDLLEALPNTDNADLKAELARYADSRETPEQAELVREFWQHVSDS